MENDEGFGMRRKFEELEQESADLLEQTKNLQEQNRSLQVLYIKSDYYVFCHFNAGSCG